MWIDELIPHLRALASKPSWRYSKVPPQITHEVLNQLNDARLIETRLWGRQGHDGHFTEKPVPLIWIGRGGWFVVSDNYGKAGTLDEILAHREYQGDCLPEFQLSERAQNLLRDANNRSGSSPSGGGQDGEEAGKKPARKPGRPRKSKLDKVELAIRKMIDSGDVKCYQRKWKDLRVRYHDQLPARLTADGLRKRVEREESRRAADSK